jgi:ornithine cyclodeaminase/alanine dehydrogenase
MATEIRALSRQEVAELMPGVEAQLDLVDETYRAMARGEVELPPKPGVHPRQDAFIHAMPAYLRYSDVAALKWVSGYPANPKRGLPYISGLIIVNDAETGLPIGLMDAAEITAARTAAASGLCVRRFGPEGWSRAAILGCGEQGRYHARILEALNQSVAIRAFDPVAQRAQQVSTAAEAVADPRTAVEGADVIVTAGPIVQHPDPTLEAEWLQERHLLLPIDFDFYAHASAIEAAELFVVDEIDQFDYYRGQGHFAGWRPPDASVGEALLSASRADKVVCVNLGVGSLDAAFAHVVLQRAVEAGAGAVISI